MIGSGAREFSDRLLTMAPPDPVSSGRKGRAAPEVPEVAVERDARVVDEDVERLDLADGFPDLPGVRHVQGQGGDAHVGVSPAHARAGVYPPRTPAQGLVHQRAPA